MNKLSNSINSNSVKLIELYNKIESNSLVTGPDFQRNLVWKKQHKYAFIETILLNYPFPEVYIASLEVDITELKAKEVVVDGQQRLTTIVEYIKGTGDFGHQKVITSFDDLTPDAKKDFLNYSVTVKDLKDIGTERIIDIFQRINSTNYQLNSNEKQNAVYGGGEFAIFANALIDPKEDLSESRTDIRISLDDRDMFVNFFKENKVFTDNDARRMFDAQFIMLISSTILEGEYFGRNSKIEQYLKKYNTSFDLSEQVISKLKNSIGIINKLHLSDRSYWLNKPNLLTLIFELRDKNEDDINLEVFETKLLELERKMDTYFNADEETFIEHITQEERKYFEVARQGSHELDARILRGKLIARLIDESKLVTPTVLLPTIPQPIDKDYAVIIPTKTGLEKSIMDAVVGVREFLDRNGIHDYENQISGPDNKVIRKGIFKDKGNSIETTVSLYRSAGRGDFRIWFKGLGSFAKADEELAIWIDAEKTIVVEKLADFISSN